MADVYLSFSGCGFLGIYHVGAASCIKQYAPTLYQNKVAGASAGALVGCVLICNCCLGQCTSYTLRLAARARMRALGPLHPDFDLIKHLRMGLEEILPMDAHVRCTGRLFVSVTRVSDGENVLLSNFPTREHLIQALMCSTFIPLYSGMTPPTFDGVAYVDGAFSNNLPRFKNAATVTVCPFAGESDICPRDPESAHSMLMAINPAGTPFLMTDVNINRLSQVLFPPHPVDLAKICQDGFRDALRFLSISGYINRMPDIIQLQACVTSAKSPPVSRVGGRSSAVTSDDESGSESYRQPNGRRNSLESNLFQRYRRRHGSADSHDVSGHIPHRSGVLPQDSATRNRASSGELHFLPPLARREFMAHLEDSQGILYSLFQSKAYRICSVLASPLYLPGEVCLRLMRKISSYTVSTAKSMFRSTLGRVYGMLEYFYSTAVLYSPIVITSQPDGRLVCSLDLIADRLNGESAEDIFRKKKPLPNQRDDKRSSEINSPPTPLRNSTNGVQYPNSPASTRSQHLVHLHLNSSSDDPEKVRRLAHGPIDTGAASACLSTLLHRSTSVDGVDSPDLTYDTDAIADDFHVLRPQKKLRRSVTTEDNASTIEQLVGGRGKPNNAPVLSYYYPDRQTDRLLVWELKELDSSTKSNQNAN